MLAARPARRLRSVHRMLPRALVILLTFTSLAAGQTTIALRPSAQLPNGAQEVRLADIADVSGPDAAALNSLVIAGDIAQTAGRDGQVPLTLDRVRTALEGQPGVNLGKIAMRGGTCTVQVATASAEARPARTPPGRTDRRAEPAAIDISGPPTIRTAIAEKLAAAHGVEHDDLRIGFDDSDESVLSRDAGGRLDIHFGGNATSPRLPITVTMYEADPSAVGNLRIAFSRTVQADVLIRRAVPVAATVIERGRPIGSEDLVNEIRWVTPTRAEQPAIDDLIGLNAQRRIAAGQTVSPTDVAAPQACKRGDTVFVHCLSGGLVVKVKAKALSSARDGELVQLKIDGSEEPFEARMSGRGRAVMEVR